MVEDIESRAHLASPAERLGLAIRGTSEPGEPMPTGASYGVALLAMYLAKREIGRAFRQGMAAAVDEAVGHILSDSLETKHEA